MLARLVLRAPRYAALLLATGAAVAPPPSAAQTNAAAPERPLPTPRVERGVVAIECAAGEAGSRSHGAIVAIGAERPARDVVITVAHALPPTPDAVRRDCRVIGERDRRYEIEAVWLGGPARAADWAVLVTARRLDGRAVLRLPVDEDAHADVAPLAARRARVRLVHGAGDAGCEIRATKWLTRAELDAAVFAHSCESWAGLSGSPLLSDAAAETLVGVHMGELVMPPGDEPAGGEPEPLLSLGRSFDPALRAALAEAAAVARQRAR